MTQFELVTVRVLEPRFNSRHQLIRAKIESARSAEPAPKFDNEFPRLLHVPAREVEPQRLLMPESLTLVPAMN